MHFLIGLGILGGLVWFAFGAGAARILVGVALLGVVAVFGFIFFVAAVDIRRQSVEQAASEKTVREQEVAGDNAAAAAAIAATDAKIVAAHAALSAGYAAPAEIHHMAEAYSPEADRGPAAERSCMAEHNWDRAARTECEHAGKRSVADHVAAVRSCMAKHNWDRDAQAECDK
jgi:predicted lipid-binding transport protein (Tim44 family)